MCVSFRNPNTPVPLNTPWPQYTTDQGEYLGLSSNLTVRSKMRPEKMALWNEYLISLTSVEPTMASKTPTVTNDTGDNDDHKGMKNREFNGIQLLLHDNLWAPS